MTNQPAENPSQSPVPETPAATGATPLPATEQPVDSPTSGLPTTAETRPATELSALAVGLQPVDSFLRAYATSRDPAIREQLVILHLSLVSRLAQRIAGRGDQLDDLIQVGYIGLIKAIDRFEPERCVKFTTYAIPTIEGEMRRYLRDKVSIIRIPRHLQELRTAIDRVSDQLCQQLNRPPTREEIANALGIDPREVADIRTGNLAAPISLDHPSCPDDESTTLILEFGRESEDLRRFEDRLLLERAFEGLTLRQRAILYLLFYEDLSQAEIGERLSISQMHVSRLSRAALERLRQGLSQPEESADERAEPRAEQPHSEPHPRPRPDPKPESHDPERDGTREAPS